jgi:hypothetical protein
VSFSGYGADVFVAILLAAEGGRLKLSDLQAELTVYVTLFPWFATGTAMMNVNAGGTYSYH